MKKIRFTPHAEEKLTRLRDLGVTKEKVIQTVENPISVVSGYRGRKIAQGHLSGKLILRVIYEEYEDEIVVVTVYPAERRRYL